MEQLKKTRDELVIEHDNLCDKYNELRKQHKMKLTAKTKVERIEEKVKIEIELEKLYNKIEVLSRVIDAIDTKISLSNSTESIDFVQKIKSNVIVTPESINESLNQFLEKAYQKLDILSTKSILVREFKNERLKGLDKYNFVPNSTFVGCFSAVCLGTTVLNIFNLQFSLINLFLSFGIPFVVGFAATTSVQVKKTNQRIKAFNNLNHQLGKDAIATQNDDYFEEYNDIENLIDKKIHDIMIIEITKRDYQRALEYFSEEMTTSKEKNKTQNNNYSLNYPNSDMESTKFRTVIANSGRWAGYKDISSDYPSKMARECSFRTERDDTIEPGVLYRHLECDDEILQEQDGPKRVRKLTQNKTNNS